MRNIKINPAIVIERIEELLEQATSDLSHKHYDYQDALANINSYQNGSRKAIYGFDWTPREMMTRLIECDIAGELARQVVWDNYELIKRGV